MNYVYRVHGSEWTRLDDPVTLLGNSGLFIDKCVLHPSTAEDSTAQVLWFAQSAGQLLHRWNRRPKYASDDLRLVVDLKPRRAKEEVNLYELRTVWGGPTLSPLNEWWCPMLWRLDTLWHDTPRDEMPPDWRPRKFTSPESREPVYEFLYCRYKVQEGSWGWGTLGRVNGTLLFPDFLTNLHEKMPANWWFDEGTGT